MLQDERVNDPVNTLKVALRGWQSLIWTALPGIVQSVDREKWTCTVQPTIQAKVRSPQGVVTDVSLPVLQDCPICLPSAGGFGIVLPIAEGDEGLVVFASRCIDNWWQSGGVQPQAEIRLHDLSDGFFLPGVFSQPRVPAALPEDVAQLRLDDGTAYVQINRSGAVRIAAPGGVIIDGGLVVNGNVQATGGVKAGAGGVDEVNLQTHVHGGGPPPTPGS